MTLQAYRHARLVVQNARTSVLAAARAMATNHIGCVVVVRSDRIVGIVTDRDLVLRGIAAGRDPSTTTLGEVMTADVATLSPRTAPEEALALMKARRIRRVPLVERGRLVGMVTLDDLLFDEAAPLEEVAAVVRAQLVEGGPAPTRRFDEWQHFQRRYARADAARAKLVAATQEATKLRTRARAEKALWLVLVAVARSLAPAELAKVVAQLPALLRVRLLEHPPGAPVTREELDDEVANELAVPVARAKEIVDAVGHAIAKSTTTGATLRRALPRDLGSIFASRSVRRSARVTKPSRDA